MEKNSSLTKQFSIGECPVIEANELFPGDGSFQPKRESVYIKVPVNNLRGAFTFKGTPTRKRFLANVRQLFLKGRNHFLLNTMSEENNTQAAEFKTAILHYQDARQKILDAIVATKDASECLNLTQALKELELACGSYQHWL